MSEVKWIKINTNIFDHEKIQFIEELPEADTIIVIWFKLLTIAGKKNDCGMIYITRDIPYKINMLVKVLSRPANIIQLAIETFVKLNMIEVIDDIISIKNWSKYQNIEGMEKLKLQWKNASKKYRDNKKLLIEDKSHKTSYDGHNIDKNRVDKKRIDKSKYGSLENVLLTKDQFNKLINDYNKDMIDKYLEDLSLYIPNRNGKPYIDHNAVIRKWIRDDIKKGKLFIENDKQPVYKKHECKSLLDE